IALVAPNKPWCDQLWILTPIPIEVEALHASNISEPRNEVVGGYPNDQQNKNHPFHRKPSLILYSCFCQKIKDRGLALFAEQSRAYGRPVLGSVASHLQGARTADQHAEAKTDRTSTRLNSRHV